MDYRPQLESFLRHSPPKSFWRCWRKVLPWMAVVGIGIQMQILGEHDTFGTRLFAATASASDWFNLIVFQWGPYLVVWGGVVALPVALLISQWRGRKSGDHPAPQSFWHSSPQNFWRYWWGAFPWMMGAEIIFRQLDRILNPEVFAIPGNLIARMFDALISTFLPTLQILITAALAALIVAWVMRQKALWKAGADSSEPEED